MTIHQLKEPCWVLRNPCGDEEHYEGKAPAMAELVRLKEDDPDPDATIHQLETPCWVVGCDGECEVTLDTEDEGYIVHCESRQAAEDLMASYEWRYVGDGAFPLVFCPEDAPDGGEVPPPSPAQLEAAGQMRLPGVA